MADDCDSDSRLRIAFKWLEWNIKFKNSMALNTGFIKAFFSALRK